MQNAINTLLQTIKNMTYVVKNDINNNENNKIVSNGSDSTATGSETEIQHLLKQNDETDIIEKNAEPHVVGLYNLEGRFSYPPLKN